MNDIETAIIALWVIAVAMAVRAGANVLTLVLRVGASRRTASMRRQVLELERERNELLVRLREDGEAS